MLMVSIDISNVALEFLTTPFRDQELLDAVEAGLARDRVRRERERALAALRKHLDTLIAESAVHRTNMMRKMKARSLPELTRMTDNLNVRLPQR
jgi:FixJ family two-component response regulator